MSSFDPRLEGVKEFDPRLDLDQFDTLLLAVMYWNDDGAGSAPELEDGPGASFDLDGLRANLIDAKRRRIEYDPVSESLFLHPSAVALTDLEIRGEIDQALGGWRVSPHSVDLERFEEPPDL